jgi:hypothetical protein
MFILILRYAKATVGNAVLRYGRSIVVGKILSFLLYGCFLLLPFLRVSGLGGEALALTDTRVLVEVAVLVAVAVSTAPLSRSSRLRLRVITIRVILALGTHLDIGAIGIG